MATTSKRALVLSGGGEKGSWQAGAILKLIEKGNRYDGVFGVSVGALNGSFMAQYQKQHQAIAAQNLKKLWWDINTKKVCKHHSWLLRWLAVPWKRSVYDATPLRKLIDATLDRDAMAASGVHFECGYTDMQTGEYAKGNSNAHVFSSASFPVMLSPGEVDGHMTTDGGIVHVTPIGAAIEWGATHVDVITLNPPGIPSWTPPKRSWFYPKIQDQLLRVLDIMIEHVIENDIKMTHHYNALCQTGAAPDGKRHIKFRVFRPETDIPTESLNFDTATMRKAWQLGYDFIK